MTLTIPPSAVIRISRGNFDPAHFADVERMARETGTYLIPAIKRLPGLLQYSAAVSPSGSMVHVSIWASDEHAVQMGQLKEMIVDARRAALAVGIEFIPIINYPITWNILPGSIATQDT